MGGYHLPTSSSDDTLFRFDEAYLRGGYLPPSSSSSPPLAGTGIDGGLASSMRRNTAPSSMESTAPSATESSRFGGNGGFGPLDALHYGHSSVAASPGMAVTTIASSPLPIPTPTPGSLGSSTPAGIYSPTTSTRGWAEVVSSSAPTSSKPPGLPQSAAVAIPKDPYGSFPGQPQQRYSYSPEQSSPRKQDGFPPISARRSSQSSDYDLQGGDDASINSRRRSSSQKGLGSPGGKITRKLDFGSNSSPLLGQDTRCFRVDFKSGRTGVFYVDKEKAKKVEVRVGDLVMVEADRGRDLGVITDETRPDRDAKRIFRLPTHAEVNQLPSKAQDEAKALALCQSKIKQRKLPMEVVEAEYQWDRRKLTYYFVADRRIDFRELVRELFKIYKTRIWMCSVEEQRAYELKHNTATGATNSLFIQAVSTAQTSGRYTDDPVDDEEEIFEGEDDFGNGDY